MLRNRLLPTASLLLVISVFISGLATKIAAQSYLEPHRPQFHFTPAEAWMNDPNGMVYYDGEYHLFFQHYPYASVWGPMHWGHAVSTDLVHWEQLPIALFPDEHGLIFSGSAVIDWNNTSRFGDGETPPMIAIYTYHNMVGERTPGEQFQTQGIAYSLDKGRTWTKYDGNPVIPNPGIRDFRDPKVIWHEASKRWVMVLAAADRLQFYTSSDLKDWAFASELGQGSTPQLGVWECPDLFPLGVEGTGQDKWVLIISHGGGGPNGGSCTRYMVGDFDGTAFTPDHPVEQINWLDYGKDNYAGVTWSDIPEEDGRRLFIGWMSNWEYATRVPTTEWRSAMTIPRSLHLRQTDKGLQLASKPVAELTELRTATRDIPSQTVNGYRMVLEDAVLSEVEVSFDLGNSDSRSFGVELANEQGEYIRIHYDPASSLIIIDRSNAGIIDFSPAFPGLHYIPVDPPAERMDWRIFFDQSSLELFVNDGAYVATDIFFPTEAFTRVSLFAFHGEAKVQGGKVHRLGRIWD